MWPFDQLVSTIHTRFSQVSTDYNQFHQLARKLDEENRRLDQQSVVVTGVRNMMLNRYHGVMNIGAAWNHAREGGYWAWYFGRSPTLNADVDEAARAWAWSKIKAPDVSFTGLMTAGATAFGTTSRDLQVIQHSGQHRAYKEAQFLTASTAASGLVGMTLKRVANQVQGEHARMFMQVARRSWQVSGVLAFCYGLGRIHSAMTETGPFALELRDRRDRFVRAEKQQIDQRFKGLAEWIEKHGPDGL